MKIKNISDSKQHGITLVELMIYVIIIGLLSQVLYNIVTVIYRNYQYCISQMELQQNVRYAIESISRDVEFAKDVNIDNKVLTIYKSDNDKDFVVSYEISKKYHPYRLMRDNQPVTGESSIKKIEISNFLIRKKGKNILDVEIKGVDCDSGDSLAVERLINIMNET